ncbi:MAG: site-specific DNA-methyltransferase [Candidatus Bathyarchaeota archaeon]|nr:site-specific DNA-methyltransferase [Candidatus Bathyarchaeota archaeon]
MVQIEEDVREKVKSLLRELFQFDNQDLDFGIYRIMNFKRKEIEKFIEQDLIAEAERQFQEYSQVGQADLKNEVERLKAEIVRDFGEGTIDSEGKVKKNSDSPKVKLYDERKKLLEQAQLTQTQVSDVFNHIYEFFSRYYDRGDFIPKRRYGGKNKYYIPYNGEEVALYWATKNMYYVKTGEYFNKYSFRTGRYLITLVLSEAKVEVGNSKGEKKYFLLLPDNPVTINEEAGLVEIRFNYRGLTDEESSRLGKQDIQVALINTAFEQIAASVAKSSVASILKPRAEEEKSPLEKHLNSYVERNTRDFFIHTNLKGFLESEIDFYLKNEVWSLSELEAINENKARLLAAKAKAIHNIATKIIEFLDQIENFQKKLYEKKKLVLSTNYCMTLDRVPSEFYDEIGKNERQVQEWKQLFKLDEITKGSFYNTRNKQTLPVDFLKQYKYLVVDTVFFPQDFKDRLLQQVDNVDEFIEGLMIKGDNFQALRLLEPKFSEKVTCVYIDPPYNLGGDDFLYKDNYQHSSWLTMMKSCLEQATALLKAEGSIFTSIDDTEQSRLRELQNTIFGQDNFVTNIIWQKKYSPQNDAKWFSDNHDFIICYAKKKELWRPNLLPRTDKQNDRYKNPDNDYRGLWKPSGLDVKTYSAAYDYPITTPSGRVVNPPAGACWRVPPKRFKELVQDKRIWFGEDGNNVPCIKRFLSEVKEGITPLTIWTYQEVGHNQEGKQELKAMISEGEIFNTPKAKRLLKRIITIGASSNSIILDFFAGSGTTAEATLDLNMEDSGKRKYILVETGDYFESTMKRRIQKAMFSSVWKDGIPQATNGKSHCFKYQYIENYEDTLNNIIVKESDKTAQETLDRFEDYFLRYMLDYETKESSTRLMMDSFEKPFDYKIRVVNSIEEKTITVDLVETFNYLLGLSVEKIQRFVDGGRVYKVVIGKLENNNLCIIWRDLYRINPEEDKAFIENKILSNKGFDRIYLNGDSLLKNALPIESEFKRLMGA